MNIIKNTFKLTFVIVSFALGLLFVQPIYAENNDNNNANSLTKSSDFFIDGKIEGTRQLSDEIISTQYKFKKRQTVKIESKEPVSSIYVMFNKPPQMWQIMYDNQQSPCGKYGFMHELIEFDTSQTSLELTFEQNTEICDIYLFSKGELPKFVEKWEPPYEDADMLLLPTHADDEHIFFGGIMPYYAGQLNKKVQVAYLTNHYGEWYRPHELLAGLWHVGIKAYPIIPKFNDYYSQSLEHAKTLYDTNAMLEYQVKLLRRFKPEVVIGHDINGEYGHGVHMLNTNLLKQALELCNDKNAMPDSAMEYGTFNVPKTYLHLYDKNQLVMDVDFSLSHFDDKTAYEMAVEGFAKHKSQTKSFTVEKKGKYDCRKFGLYRSTVGEDVIHKDFFENIIYDEPIQALSQASSNISVSSKEEISSTNSKQALTANKKEQVRERRSSLFIMLGIIVVVITFRFSNKRQRYKNSKR